MNFDLAQIVRATGGRLHPATARGSVAGVSTDSRKIAPGELFVALRGPNFDGHDFLNVAVERQAAAVLCERPAVDLAIPQIEVGDSQRALGDLARAWRAQFALPLVAVTGSSGKTTTKEMLAAILALTGPGLKTAGNFNNLIGLPLTLFALKDADRWAVLEMGMSERGEIARLAEIATPAVGIITNVGPAHLETLKTPDGVARAKGELFIALPPGGTAVINADDSRVNGLPVANGVRRLLFGTAAPAEIRSEAVTVSGATVGFRLLLPQGPRSVTLQCAGRHNVANALAAAAAATALGVEPELIVRGLEAFRAGKGRMEVLLLDNDLLLIEDSYNANPLSMRAALVALDETIGGGGRRVAVLGDMLELGEGTAAMHHDIGVEAARRVDLLIVLGAQAGAVAEGAREGGLAAAQVLCPESHEAAIEVLRQQLRGGDRVLVKGSRGMRMERISSVLSGMSFPAGPGN